MSKGTKYALVALAVLLLVCGTGFWSMFSNANKSLEQARADAATEGNAILILLSGSWDASAIELRTAKGYEPDTANVAKWKDQFGGLVSGDVRLTDFQIGSDLLTAKLACTAEFDKGKGDVTMTLTREPGNSWMLADFDVKPSP